MFVKREKAIRDQQTIVRKPFRKDAEFFFKIVKPSSECM